MSRHHDSNIDPFNAGEPVMPEDTQPDDFPGDACSFADKDYSAPRKRPDAYRAPTDNSPASVADNSSSVADKRAHRAWKAAFKTRDDKTNQKPRATNHTKSSSSSSKTPARRSKLAIFILIVFILVVAGNLLDSTLFDESPFASFEETFSTHDDDTFDHPRARQLDPSELNEEESTVYDVTCQTLSALQDNEDVRERICNNLSQELKTPMDTMSRTSASIRQFTPISCSATLRIKLKACMRLPTTKIPPTTVVPLFSITLFQALMILTRPSTKSLASISMTRD